ncbi:MAG: GAF domain-containing protein, partial [Ktedonobacteraceae bacterium]|nr:GAF domain-containing protein [Ktedonobacteraceae bacterium]
PHSGMLTLLGGTLLITAAIYAVDRLLVPIPNPGVVYLPLVAMLAYHWGTRLALVAVLLQLLCVYLLFLPPEGVLKTLTPEGTVQLFTLAAVSGFTLALVQLASSRRASAERDAERLVALNRVGAALASELEEERLLRLIAQTACDLTGANFAAFTLRPMDENGQPLVPSEGSLFRLAAVVGVSPEHERILQRMRLGGEGLLAPIFRQGVPVRVDDALAYTPAGSHRSPGAKEIARQHASAFAHGRITKEQLKSLGIPKGHPVVRSFLGVPLLNRQRQVQGGLLLGCTESACFTQEHEDLLVGLAAQAAIALENARLYRVAQMRARELDAIFQSIADGVILVDEQGNILRENVAARRVREMLARSDHEESVLDALLRLPARQVMQGEYVQDVAVNVVDDLQEVHTYLVNAAPLLVPGSSTGTDLCGLKEQWNGAVLVWHDITEAQRLLTERQARADAEARRALLQLVLDELPTSAYLVRGRDARLVLANRAATMLWGANWTPGQPLREFLRTNGIRLADIEGQQVAVEQSATMRAVMYGETVRQYQETILRADNSSVPVLVNAVPLEGQRTPTSPDSPSGGQNDSLAGTMEPAALVVQQDVSALKATERLKDEFIGIAAHELRTPLAVLKGFAQTLLLQHAHQRGPQLADWQLEALQGIDQATARMAELTGDLLDVTRLQAGRLSFQREPVDLVALARRIVNRLQMTTQKHSIILSTELEHLVVNVDQRRFEQVLSNLIGNAIKYSPQGGEILVSVCELPEIHTARIAIQDHGIGIPARQQGQIFSRFVRADNASALGIGGTGLGLYLSRELVERQGGRIWFESEEGKGSTFFIELPVLATEQLE